MANNFVHLHVHSEFSLLDGAARISKLIKKAKYLDMPALAITDHGVMYGVIDFYKEAIKEGIKPIIGCEIYVSSGSRFEKNPALKDDSYHLILLAENNIGYENIIKIVSLSHIEGFYYKPRADKDLLKQYSEGVICLSSCLAGEIPRKILSGDFDGAQKAVEEYIDIYGKNNFFLELQNHYLPEDEIVNPKLIEYAQKYELDLVATNDLHYVDKDDSEAQDILLCIQTNRVVEDKDRMRFGNSEFYLKSADEMLDLFPNQKDAINNTLKIAQRCNVKIDFSHLLLPEFDLPKEQNAKEYLRTLCLEGMERKYPVPNDAVFSRLDYELGVIHSMGYDSYFLIVWDFIKFARENGIAVGPGRGSAAGSIVSYLLDITNIDPLKYNLLFERFLNPERISMPDIDIDFCYERRQEVFDYIVRKYGSENVAQIITFGTMAARAAVRDVGRALNMPYGDVDKIAKMIPNELGITLDRALSSSKELYKIYRENESVGKLIDLSRALEGTPRHSSVHAAGVVIAPKPLAELIPLQLSSEDFITTQYNKDQVEDVGLLKMDILGLRTLTVIADALKLVEENHNLRIDINNIDLKDKKTCQVLAKGDTAGIFQMESAGMTQLVKDLKPEGFEDLIPLVALYRPGPLGSGMAKDFINGRHGDIKVHYPHPLLEPILKETFGVILYQEQVMQITSVLSGFSLAQADVLRRAMGKKQAKEMAEQKESFIIGAEKNNVTRKKAEEIFALLEHFAGYGFNKSHSAAYALLAYQTAWLKAHYPVEFMAAMLSSIMKANEKVSHYIEVCHNMKIKILPPDVNKSKNSFSVDKTNIRFGLAAIKNVGDAAIDAITSAREKHGEFKSILDFCRNVDMRSINKRVMESLIKCGAFDSMGKRSQLLNVLESVVGFAIQRQKDDLRGQVGLFDVGEAKDTDLDIKLPDLDEIPKEVMLSYEKEIIGFYVTGHPLDKYRDLLKNIESIEDLENNRKDGLQVKIGGIISSIKRMNTKKGDLMASIVLEDFISSCEVLVFPKTFDNISPFLIVENAVLVKGRLSLDDEKFKIIAEDIQLLDKAVPTAFLSIQNNNADKEFFQRIKDVLLSYNGNSTVVLDLTFSNKKVKISDDIRINALSDDFKKDIEKIIGEGGLSLYF